MMLMTAKNYEAWDVLESDYPSHKTMQEKLMFLLRYAILAPSGPNTRPGNLQLVTAPFPYLQT